MIEPDTIKLLRECDAGIKMGVSAIDDVVDYVNDDTFKRYLVKCKNEHEMLKEEIQNLLDQYHDEGKNPNPMAKSMSWMSRNMYLPKLDVNRLCFANLIASNGSSLFYFSISW